MADTIGDQGGGTSRASHVRSFAKDVEALTGKKPKDMAPVVAPPTPPVKAAAPPPPPPKPVNDTPLPPKEVRDDILERLRAKVATYKEAPPVLADALPTVKSPDVPPIPLTAKPAVPPPTSSKTAPIHTYKSDFAEYVDEKNASVFSVLAAEKDATLPKPQEIVAQKKTSRAKYVIGGMLILIGLVSVYAAYRWAHNMSVVPTEDIVPSLVFADARRELAPEQGTLMQALASVAGTRIPQGNVTVVYITTSTTTDKGIIKLPQTGGALVRALSLKAPDILLRNVMDESTVGVINAGEETRAFFVFRVSSYERTFAGMLEWEESIARDLADLYPSYPAPPPPPVVGTSTATSTVPEVIAPPRFVDVVVASRDARILRDSEGRTILIYGYRDKQTLVIARDENAFAQLIARITATDAN